MLAVLLQTAQGNNDDLVRLVHGLDVGPFQLAVQHVRLEGGNTGTKAESAKLPAVSRDGLSTAAHRGGRLFAAEEGSMTNSEEMTPERMRQVLSSTLVCDALDAEGL